jgi:hypothetical protein
MTEQLPTWPTTPPAYGSVVLRAFTDEDAHLAVEQDVGVPLVADLHPWAADGPGQRPLRYVPVAAQPAAGLDAASGDPRG